MVKRKGREGKVVGSIPPVNNLENKVSLVGFRREGLTKANN